MSLKLLVLLAFVTAGECGVLGSKKCTYGPSYWCSHLHHAKECSAVQHCLTTVWAKQQPEMTGTTETCFDVINSLNLVRSAGEAETMSRIAMACTGFSDEKRAKCKELVKNDEDEVHMLLKSDLPSSAIATALGLCGGFQDTVPHPGQNKETNATGNYCNDCVNFFGDLREIFNSSEGQAEAALKNLVCPMFGSLQDLCNQLIDQYAAMAFNIVYQQMDPQDICYMLQMCTNTTRAAIMEKLRAKVDKLGADKLTCVLCMNMAKSVQDALADEELQKEITTEIENTLCPLLPGKMAAQCKTYVTAYAPIVFQLIVSEMDPKSFCIMMTMCGATAQPSSFVRIGLESSATNVRIITPDLKATAEKKVEAGPTCALCEYILDKLVGMLQSNATEDEIRQGLVKVCGLLPQTLSEECTSFVNAYAPLIIKLLLEEVAPQAVCTMLKLCLYSPPQTVKVMAPAVTGVECDLCEQVITYVNQEMANSTKSIEQVLKGVCDKVPAAYKAVCEELVDAYTPAIINILSQYDDPAKVCTAIGLCSSAKPKINTSNTQSGASLMFVPMMEMRPARRGLVGNHKCTYGPDFWCASKENAISCNIPLEHCETKYGKKFDNNA